MKTIALAGALVLAALPALAQTFALPLNQYEMDQQVSTSGASSFLLTSPQKALASLTVVAGASAGYALVLDAASAPANGAIGACASAATARPCLMWCAPVAANGFVDRQWNSPMSFSAGVLVMFSTTGCSTITASGTAQIFAQAP
jgi:hypothetical protein